MKREIYYELTKDNTKYTIQFRPIPKTPKYQILVDNVPKYMGVGFRLDECMERLSFFEKNGFSVKVLSKQSNRK